jgi:hypothetical protein
LLSDSETEENEKVLVDLKPVCMRYSNGANFFSLFSKSKISIEDVPFDQVQLRKVNTKQRRSHSSPLDNSYSLSSNPINQAFFAVPVATCLTYDLYESINDHKTINLDSILRLYLTNIESLKDLATPEDRFAHL